MKYKIKSLLLVIPFLIALSSANSNAMAGGGDGGGVYAAHANRAQERANIAEERAHLEAELERFLARLLEEQQQYEERTQEELLEIARHFQGHPEDLQEELRHFQGRAQEAIEERRRLNERVQRQLRERHHQIPKFFLTVGIACFTGFAAVKLHNWMFKKTNTPTNKALIGKTALVTTTIRPGQKGEIILNGKKIAARTQQLQKIYAETSVKIVGKGWSQTDGNYVIVQRAANPASI